MWENLGIDHDDWNVVYEALMRDAREGNFYSYKALSYLWEDKVKYGETTAVTYNAELVIEYRYTNGDNSYAQGYGNIFVQLQPTMKHTLKALIAVGVLDQTIIDSWSFD